MGRSIAAREEAREGATETCACRDTSRGRERRAHLLPISGKRHGDGAGDGERNGDDRAFGKNAEAFFLRTSDGLEQSEEPRHRHPLAGTLVDERRRRLAHGGRHHHEAQNGAEEHELQNRPCRCGELRTDEQHEQSAHDHERREHEHRAANRAGEMTGRVADDRVLHRLR